MTMMIVCDCNCVGSVVEL